MERTWITPLNEAATLIRDCKDEIAGICRALHVVGNSALADRLADISADLSQAINLQEEGRNLALKACVDGAEAASINMVNAAIAALSK